MPRDINVSSWQEIARAIFGIVGGNPLPELEDALRAVVVLESDRPEWQFPAGIYPFWTDLFTSAAVAAEFSGAWLHNPSSSGSLIVVTDIQSTQVASADVLSGLLGTTVVDSSTAGDFNTDTRYRPSPTLQGTAGLRLVTTSLAAGVVSATPHGIILSVNGAAGAGSEWSRPKIPFILGPDGIVGIQGQVVNAAVSASFAGYIKPLHKGERG